MSYAQIEMEVIHSLANYPGEFDPAKQPQTLKDILDSIRTMAEFGEGDDKENFDLCVGITGMFLIKLCAQRDIDLTTCIKAAFKAVTKAMEPQNKKVSNV